MYMFLIYFVSIYHDDKFIYSFQNSLINNNMLNKISKKIYSYLSFMCISFKLEDVSFIFSFLCIKIN